MFTSLLHKCLGEATVDASDLSMVIMDVIDGTLLFFMSVLSFGGAGILSHTASLSLSHSESVSNRNGLFNFLLGR